MKLIVAADTNWAIGKDNGLLERISDDMKFFAGKTTGNVIIVGRKTLESFPGGKPLPRRVNIVITRQEDYDGKGAVVVRNMDELKSELMKHDTDSVFVAGGESIYRMLLPYCDTAYVTKIEKAHEADTWMPNLDEDENWSLTDAGEKREAGDVIYRFSTYTNAKPMSL